MKLLALKLPGGYEVTPPGNIPSGGTDRLQQILQTTVALVFIVAIILALFMLVLGGIQWIISGGEKQGLENARKRIIYAIVGLIVIFLAFFIVNFIGHFFGITLFLV